MQWVKVGKTDLNYVELKEGLNKNDIVFIKTELKDIYFKNYHSKIEVPYILICHNSDDIFDEESKLNLDEKIIHFIFKPITI